MAVNYFYDEQLRRYLLQFVRIFNQFQYKTGKDAKGNMILRPIPATLASMDRQVNSIIQNNSENVILSTPQISCWISALKVAHERRQDPNYIRTTNVWKRDIDTTTQSYTEDVGNIYSVQSYMPVPYDLTMQADIWTSNELQKHQVLEQILVLFNPSIDLQTSNNPLDWTSLTVVELSEITWSSRTYPTGATDTIDIASLTFKLPIWLNAPSKLNKRNIIQQIIIDIGEIEKMNTENGEGFYWADSDLISRLIVTPGDFRISVSGNQVTLLNPNNSTSNCILDTEGNPMNWISLLQKYGKFRNNTSQIRLKTPGGSIENYMYDMVGTLQLNPIDPNSLYWTIDIQTLPANTITNPITDMIDPLMNYPGKGLPIAEIGQRYLLLNYIPSGHAWGGITASEHDIIEFDGEKWNVVFDMANQTSTSEYLINSMSNRQLHWNGAIWHFSIDGEYPPGYWRLGL